MLRGPRIAMLVALTACGRLGFDSELPPQEPCDWIDELTLQSPAPIDELNTDASESAPFVTADGDTLYYSSDTGGVTDFFIADSYGPELFADARRFDRLSQQNASDTSLSFAADHREVIFTSDRAGGSFDLFRGQRPAVAAPFIDMQALGALNSAGDELTPHLSESDRALYFARRTEPEGADLYVARRADLEANFEAAVRIDELSSEADDLAPALTDDGLVIVFASSRAGRLDLYYATRATTDDPFGQPVPLHDLNTSAVETDPCVTRDGCFIYFASDRHGEQLDLFVARVFR